MHYVIIQSVSALFLPPLSFLLMGAAGLALLKSRPKWGKGLIALMLVLTWFFSMPITGNALMLLIEKDFAHPVESMGDAQAIVVLGGGAYPETPEYKTGSVQEETLMRLRYAARLYKRSGLPVLVAGGDPGNEGMPEGLLMKRALEEDFGVPAKWTETASSDTIQNAAFSRKILAAEGIHSIVLVTHGWHMGRSKMLFERQGFKVIPAATGLHRIGKITAIDFLPKASGLQNSRMFFHELIGEFWAFVHRP